MRRIGRKAEKNKNVNLWEQFQQLTSSYCIIHKTVMLSGPWCYVFYYFTFCWLSNQIGCEKFCSGGLLKTDIPGCKPYYENSHRKLTCFFRVNFVRIERYDLYRVSYSLLFIIFFRNLNKLIIILCATNYVGKCATGVWCLCALFGVIT